MKPIAIPKKYFPKGRCGGYLRGSIDMKPLEIYFDWLVVENAAIHPNLVRYEIGNFKPREKRAAMSVLEREIAEWGPCKKCGQTNKESIGVHLWMDPPGFGWHLTIQCLSSKCADVEMIQEWEKQRKLATALKLNTEIKHLIHNQRPE